MIEPGMPSYSRDAEARPNAWRRRSTGILTAPETLWNHNEDDAEVSPTSEAAGTKVRSTQSRLSLMDICVCRIRQM